VCKGMLNADIEACEEVGGSRRGEGGEKYCGYNEVI